MKRSSVLSISILFFFFSASLSPAAAKVMSIEDFSGIYYGARIMDIDGALRTALYEVTADGNGGVSFITIEGSLGPLTTAYDIDDRGILVSRDGIIKGAISPDGAYLAIGKFEGTEPPQLLFGIKQSSGLTNEVVSGSYNIYLLYEVPGESGAIISSNAGNFEATDADVLSGNFTGDDPGLAFSGAYTAGYNVAPDGRLTLTFTDGQNAADLGPMHGVVSSNGDTFVAVDATREGAWAYAVGIQRSEFSAEDLAGDYHVTDFGYYDLDNNGTRDNAAGFIMDFTAADGTLSFVESASNCSVYDTCPIETEVTGTYELSEWYQFITNFENYPRGIKTGGTLNLTSGGNVFSLIHPTYLGIGIKQASGTPDPVTELTADAGEDQTVDEGTLVTLDGSASAAPEEDIDSYTWSQTAGPTVDLVNPRSIQSEFVAPEVTGDTRLTFNLEVTDIAGNTDTDSVSVTVMAASKLDGGGDDDDDDDDSSCFINSIWK